MSGFNHAGSRHTKTCEHCGKRCYATRKDAKRAARHARDGSMRPYRCLSDPEVFHTGHLPKVIKAGLMTADEVYRRSA